MVGDEQRRARGRAGSPPRAARRGTRTGPAGAAAAGRRARSARRRSRTRRPGSRPRRGTAGTRSARRPPRRGRGPAVRRGTAPRGRGRRRRRGRTGARPRPASRTALAEADREATPPAWVGRGARPSTSAPARQARRPARSAEPGDGRPEGPLDALGREQAGAGGGHELRQRVGRRALRHEARLGEPRGVHARDRRSGRRSGRWRSRPRASPEQRGDAAVRCRAGTPTVGRPIRRTAWESVTTSGAATLNVPGRSSRTTSSSARTASSGCSSCRRASKPSTRGTTGSAR